MAEDVAQQKPDAHEALEARVSETLQEALGLTATVELASVHPYTKGRVL